MHTLRLNVPAQRCCLAVLRSMFGTPLIYYWVASSHVHSLSIHFEGPVNLAVEPKGTQKADATTK